MKFIYIYHIKISKYSDEYFLRYQAKRNFFQPQPRVFCLWKTVKFFAHAQRSAQNQNIEMGLYCTIPTCIDLICACWVDIVKWNGTVYCLLNRSVPIRVKKVEWIFALNGITVFCEARSMRAEPFCCESDIYYVIKSLSIYIPWTVQIKLRGGPYWILVRHRHSPPFRYFIHPILLVSELIVGKSNVRIRMFEYYEV